MHILKIVIIIILYSFCCINIYEENNKKEKTFIETPLINIKNESIEQPIGNISIEKIKLNKPLYNINSKRNNIEENITILENSIEPSNNNSIMFLAAHSGPDPIAYFDNLDKLSINDIITLTYKNKKYYYIIKDIWETNKDGNIEVIKESSNQLILTTCSKNNNKQLIINSIKKES